MVIVCFGGPSSVMIFCYVKILRSFRGSSQQLQANRIQVAPVEAAHITVTVAEIGVSTYDHVCPSSSTHQCVCPSSNKIRCKQPVLTVENIARHNCAMDHVALSSLGDQRAVRWRWQQNTNRLMETIRRAKREKQRAETLKLTFTFLVMVFAFIVLWLPFCVTMLMSVFSASSVHRIPDMITLLLGFLNSCCNPIIYGVMNTKVRAGCARLYCSSCQHIKNRVTPITLHQEQQQTNT
jgi:hypothetical protein